MPIPLSGKPISLMKFSNRMAFPAFLGFLAFWTSFAGRKKSRLNHEGQELIEQI